MQKKSVTAIWRHVSVLSSFFNIFDSLKTNTPLILFRNTFNSLLFSQRGILAVVSLADFVDTDSSKFDVCRQSCCLS